MFFAEEYEFQFGITGTEDVQISVWGREASGNILPTQTVLASELDEIGTLTIGVP